MTMFKCPKRAVISVFFASLFCVACQKPAPAAPPEPKTGQTPTAASAEPLSVEEAHDDLVGNWRLDSSRSKSAGLKDAILAKAQITMVMEPDGSRTLYRDNQPIEEAELVLSAVESDGKLAGRFKRSSNALPLAVKIQVLDENRMQWTFPEGQRTEVFVRQVVEPSPDFKE